MSVKIFSIKVVGPWKPETIAITWQEENAENG